MKRLGLFLILLTVSAAGAAEGPAYDAQVIGAGTFTFLQPRALRAGPDGAVYLIEGDSDWATARRIAPDLASSRRFSAKVVTSENVPERWFHPAGLHVTQSGDLLVADTGRRRILRLTGEGEFRSVVVGPGGPADLVGPTDAVELPSGEIVVCDSASSRILLFDSQGTFKRLLAGPGADADQVNHPFSLALDRDGGLWIADTLNRRLVRRGRDLRVSRVVRPAVADGPLFAWLSYLDVDREGNLLVADDGRSCVFKLSPGGEVLLRLGMGEGERRPFSRVSGVAALPDGTVLACDLARNVLVRFDAEGKLLGEMGHSRFRGRGAGIVAAGVDRSGGFYLVSPRQAPSVRYHGPDGLLRVEAAGEGTEPGKLLRPRAAAAGPDGCLYVADSELHRVTVLGPDGVLVRVFGRAGSGPSEFQYPRAIAVGPDGLVYVGDAGNRRVQLFKPTGEFIRTFARELNPYALDADAQGRVAVFDDADEIVVTFDRDGRELSRVSVQEVPSFAGMLLAADGRVWMLDRQRGVVKAFAAGQTGGAEVVLRDARLSWRALLVRGADGKAYVVSADGLCAVEPGGLGPLVEARLAVEPGKLTQPASLALVWNDELAVFSGPTGAVQIFGRDGAFRRVLETTPRIRGISHVSAGPGGDLCVLASGDGALWRVRRDGRAQVVLSTGPVRGGGAAAMLSDGRAWVDQDSRSGLVLLAADGKELGRTPAAGRFRHWGRNFSVTPAGELLLAEQSGGMVTAWGTDFTRRWSLDAEKLDESVRLYGIAATRMDARGALYVLGGGAAGVRLFGADLAFLAAVRGDLATGAFSDPSDLAVDANGTLYVADTGNNRVVKLVPKKLPSR